MPNLAWELEQLALANRHIELAQENIERMRARIEQEALQGMESQEVDRALKAARDSLSAFIEHRDLITRTIEDIRAGRLPST